MKLIEKLEILQTKHLGEWIKTRTEVREVLSNQCPIFCVCGKLATGLHESCCRKFQNMITKQTVKKLSYLLVK